MWDQLNSSNAAGTVVMADVELKPLAWLSRGELEGAVHIYLLTISLRKSYMELLVPAGLHQVSKSSWTGLVRRDDCPQKANQGLLTELICHEQS